MTKIQSNLDSIIIIENGRNSTYDFRSFLYKQGFRFSSASRWVKKIDSSDKDFIKGMKEYCKHNKLKFVMYDKRYARSGGYRQEFYKHKKPFYKDYYLCSYCGLPYHIDKITVDHVIPVEKAKKSKFYRWLLKLRGATGVNDIKNLVPACQSCNSRKNAKGGLWVLLGYLSQLNTFVVIRQLCLLIFIIVVIYTMIRSVM